MELENFSPRKSWLGSDLGVIRAKFLSSSETPCPLPTRLSFGLGIQSGHRATPPHRILTDPGLTAMSGHLGLVGSAGQLGRNQALLRTEGFV
jgi:hypothetical protein